VFRPAWLSSGNTKITKHPGGLSTIAHWVTFRRTLS